MSKIFHPLLALIASATNNELAQYVEYLKHENKILRARLGAAADETVPSATAFRGSERASEIF